MDGNVAIASKPGMTKNSFSTRVKKLWKEIKKNKYRYLLILPGFIWILIFKYLPYTGLLIAFEDFSVRKGIFASPFVGFENFKYLFGTKDFVNMIRNTLVISGLNIIFYFPLPIIISIMISEVRNSRYKRLVQSIVYLPHFLSWVIVYALTFFLLSVDVGLVNKALTSMGLERISFLTNNAAFYIIITCQTIWRETGWGTILFLAAIVGINSELYEAAAIDGAGRLRQIWHVTLPGIKMTIVTMLILRVGRVADVSLEQVLLIQNPLITSVSEVFSTYAYNYGIVKGLTSIGTAVDMFKSVVNLVFVFIAQYVCKRMGDDGIF
jgi:putative aldouronate transport system permease protein